MRFYKPVAVSKSAFIFCRTTLTVLVWASLIFHWKWMALLSVAILALSALLRIEKAPLIWVYTNCIDRFVPSAKEILDEDAMGFAHSLGALINLMAVLFLFLGNETVGWSIIFILAIIKTIGALGFCPASKLYNCLTSGGCCRFTKRLVK